MLIFEITKRNTALPQKGLAPILISQRDFNVTPCLHRVHTELLPCSIYDVLTQISNDFQRSLYHVQCRQTLAVVARHVWCRHGVTHLSRRNKATSASNRRPSAPGVLSSAGKLIRYLHGSYFLPYCFPLLFLSAISIFLSLGSAVHWTLSPPHHE